MLRRDVYSIPLNFEMIRIFEIFTLYECKILASEASQEKYSFIIKVSTTLALDPYSYITQTKIIWSESCWNRVKIVQKSCFRHLLTLVRHDLCNKSCLPYLETRFLSDFFLRTRFFHDDSTIYYSSTKIVFSKYVKHDFCTIYVKCSKGIMGRILFENC